MRFEYNCKIHCFVFSHYFFIIPKRKLKTLVFVNLFVIPLGICLGMDWTVRIVSFMFSLKFNLEKCTNVRKAKEHSNRTCRNLTAEVLWYTSEFLCKNGKYQVAHKYIMCRRKHLIVIVSNIVFKLWLNLYRTIGFLKTQINNYYNNL